MLAKVCMYIVDRDPKTGRNVYCAKLVEPGSDWCADHPDGKEAERRAAPPAKRARAQARAARR